MMSEVVSTFVNVDRGKSKYLFFLVRVNDYESTIKEEIEKNWLPFGEALGVNGTAVKAYDQKKNSTYGEVTKKPWPAKLLDQMWSARDGFMLIIEKSFVEFDPTSDRWSIIWFSDFSKDPGSIYKTFDSLAKKASNGEDIFHWVASLSKKVKNAKYRSYFDVKPGIFGVTLNAKALLEDL